MKLSLKTCLLLLNMALIGGCGDFEWFPDTTNESTTPIVNIAPVANAGSAQSVLTGDSVTLNGSGSSDVNGDTLTYLWTLTSKPDGSTADLVNATVANPTFTPDLIGAYNLSLTVNDGKVNSPTPSTVTVTVTAYNSPPVANAGPDQTVVFGTAVPVQLDGSSSTGSIQSYNWQFTEKPSGAGSVLLSSATVINPTFAPTVAGTYVIGLQVFDGLAGSTTDTVTVTVTNTGSLTLIW